MVARNQVALEEEAHAIRQSGGNAAVCVAHIGDDDFPERVGMMAIQEFGGFDSWVSNAPASLSGDLD